MADHSRRRIDPFTTFLMIACLALAVLVVLLARQNRELKTEIAEIISGMPAAHGVEAGDPLGAMTLRDETGSDVPLEFAGGEQATVLLVFSTHCPACQETIPLWSETFAAASESTARVLAVQLDEPTDDAGVVLPVPVYHLNRELSPAMEGIPYIPATIVLDGRGIVERIWFGVPEEEAITSLNAVIGAGA